MNDLYVNRVRLEMNDQKKNQYPFNIKVLKNFESLELTKPVTFLIGENGVGKSTFIEAVAVGLGLNAKVVHKISISIQKKHILSYMNI